ncbi:PREDICTED: uncharacterized protein LOC105313532 [Amphimedon queenslandica]|uniref:Uncharacterized protein n=1 Tax=Amphimedon queenslandica TaxID=400682 RepID=A0A1X7UFG6_AMPQE|nr:PREDICTED: uncharacterized protein LOC105313532 [Amphimedon queenslandica]|eukprot:XP_019854724.1 PREDICTED: uncharacterized protein LOC105313532 [Amphimedon queenslandica]
MDSKVIKDILSSDEELVKKGLTEILLSDGAVNGIDEENAEELGAFYKELCQALMTIVASHSNLICSICETVALLARTAQFKEIAASANLASLLCPSLSSPDRSTQIQTLRAIGNLCFDEDTVREQCASQDAHTVLSGLLKECVSLQSDTEVNIKYKSVLCGCTLNLCCSNEKLSGLMVGLGVIQSLSLLISDEKNEVVLKMALQALHVIIETDSCTVSHLCSSSLSSSLQYILSLHSTGIENDLLEQALELIETSIEPDQSDSSWNVKLVSSDCFHELLSLIGTELSEKIFNIIVLLITSDEAMKILFVNEELYKILKDHLHNEGLSPKVRAAAILVIANMARTDSNCEELVRRGLLVELASVVKGTPTDESLTVWFSVMSALRNLSLPASSKDAFLKEGVLDTVVNVLNASSDANVLIKAIGCLRLLSKTEDVCVHLIETNPVFSRVHAVSEMFSFPHIKIEASRLCAAIIKNSQSDTRLRLLSEEKIYSLLLYLLEAEYTILKNEGLIALTIAASFNLSVMLKSVTNEDTIEKNVNILEQEESIELKQNCLTFLKVLLDQSNDFVQLVKSSEKLVALLNQLSSLENETVNEQVKLIKEIIKC